MLIKDSRLVPAFISKDNCAIRELIHPARDGASPGLSLAQAEVAPGRATRAHCLDRLEIYYILSGQGLMRVGDESAAVGPGQAVYIPAGERQFIENIGPAPLIFLCICHPAYDPAGDQALGGEGRTPEGDGP